MSWNETKIGPVLWFSFMSCIRKTFTETEYVFTVSLTVALREMVKVLTNIERFYWKSW